MACAFDAASSLRESRTSLRTRGARGPQRRVRSDLAPSCAPVTPTSPFVALTHRNFRLLWFGQLVSQLGDWFNAVAIYALVLELTGGSATAVAIMMGVQLVPKSVVFTTKGVKSLNLYLE